MQYLYEFIMCALLKSSNIDSELTIPEIDLNQGGASLEGQGGAIVGK